MVKNLIKHGNSYALVIDKPIMELLQIQPDTPLELKTNGKILVITPLRSKKEQAKLEEAMRQIQNSNGPDFRTLL